MSMYFFFYITISTKFISKLCELCAFYYTYVCFNKFVDLLINELINELINFVVFLSKKKRNCVAEKVHLCANDIILSIITRNFTQRLGVIYVDFCEKKSFAG